MEERKFKRGLQTKVAKELGVTREYINIIANGMTRMKPGLAERLAAALTKLGYPTE